MNQISPIQPVISVAEQQWQARVDLAAAHRLCFNEGFHEGIFNHLTVRVPGTEDRYYQIPFGTHWSEVTASCLMEVGYDGTRLSGEGFVEDSAFGIHAPLHAKIATADAVFHTHMPYTTALTRLEDPRIKAIGQTELELMRSIAYDTDYHGPAIDAGEGERLVSLLQQEPGKTIVFMASHGVMTIGSIAEAYDRLYYIEKVAQVQLYAMWTGQPLKYLPPEVVQKTYGILDRVTVHGGISNAQHHFNALKRRLDKREPDYKE